MTDSINMQIKISLITQPLFISKFRFLKFKSLMFCSFRHVCASCKPYVLSHKVCRHVTYYPALCFQNTGTVNMDLVERKNAAKIE